MQNFKNTKEFIFAWINLSFALIDDWLMWIAALGNNVLMLALKVQRGIAEGFFWGGGG